MIHLTTISGAQFLLIALGAVLQFIAFLTFSRDPSVHDGLQHEGKAGDDFHAREEKMKLPAEAPLAQYYRPQIAHAPEETISDIKPAQLVKTSKVAFKQSFKAWK